jgi:hypothetical protein
LGVEANSRDFMTVTPAMHDPTLPLPGLSRVCGKSIHAKFDGGLLSSDGGVLLLREVEQRLRVADRVPDARTIWLYREKLTKAGAIEGLFARFDAALRASGYIAMSGQIVDATLVSAPKQA